MNGPWRITFDTNPDDCNLRCTMCEEHSILLTQRKFEQTGHRRRMDPETIAQVIAECAPRGLREVIPSTMGEPLLYAGFPRIMEACRQHGVLVNLTTNGTFPIEGASRWAELLVPACSDVKISWNGVTPAVQEGIMHGSRLDVQQRNLAAFLDVRNRVRGSGSHACTVTLQCTFLETNLGQLPDLVRFAIDLGVDRVKGHHLWVHNDIMAAEDMRRDSKSVARWNDVVRLCHEIAADNPLHTGEIIQLANFDEIVNQETRTRTGPCPFLGQEAWVNSQGRFDPCCAPDYLRQSLGSFGTVDRGLLPIWEGHDYATLRQSYQEQEVCKTCVMRAP